MDDTDLALKGVKKQLIGSTAPFFINIDFVQGYNHPLDFSVFIKFLTNQNIQSLLI